MNKKELENFKQKLQSTKAELESALSSFASKDPQVKGDWDTKYPEFSNVEDPNVNMEEEASEVEAYVTRLPIEHSYELRLQAIGQALERINKGTYGKCSNCGKPIPTKRLEAYPEADKCLSCEQKVRE